jgi:uncharacterized protein (TIGR00297 family)
LGGISVDGFQETSDFIVTGFHQSGALPAAVVAVAFAVLARALRAVTDGGALMGAVIAFLLMNAAGLWGFPPLMVVFFLTLLATRWRAEFKRSLGVAERGGGRNAWQVLANLGAAGLCALAASMFPHHSGPLLVAAMAVLAEAAADTVSSEAGQAVASRPRMILGFQPAPPGTNGAVSLEGTFAGCIAACAVAWTATLCGVIGWRWAPVVAAAGAAGMILDSVLGAALENRGKIGNDAVNFVSTVFAADLALLLALLVDRGLL